MSQGTTTSHLLVELVQLGLPLDPPEELGVDARVGGAELALGLAGVGEPVPGGGVGGGQAAPLAAITGFVRKSSLDLFSKASSFPRPMYPASFFSTFPCCFL